MLFCVNTFYMANFWSPQREKNNCNNWIKISARSCLSHSQRAETHIVVHEKAKITFGFIDFIYWGMVFSFLNTCIACVHAVLKFVMFVCYYWFTWFLYLLYVLLDGKIHRQIREIIIVHCNPWRYSMTR